MVVIPAGNFLMGAPADESGRNEIEGPQRRVTIAQFSAGKFDITLGMEGVCQRYEPQNCRWVRLGSFESGFGSRRLVGEAGLPTG